MSDVEQFRDELNQHANHWERNALTDIHPDDKDDYEPIVRRCSNTLRAAAESVTEENLQFARDVYYSTLAMQASSIGAFGYRFNIDRSLDPGEDNIDEAVVYELLNAAANGKKANERAVNIFKNENLLDRVQIESRSRTALRSFLGDEAVQSVEREFERKLDNALEKKKRRLHQAAHATFETQIDGEKSDVTADMGGSRAIVASGRTFNRIKREENQANPNRVQSVGWLRNALKSISSKFQGQKKG